MQRIGMNTTAVAKQDTKSTGSVGGIEYDKNQKTPRSVEESEEHRKRVKKDTLTQMDKKASKSTVHVSTMNVRFTTYRKEYVSTVKTRIRKYR